MTTVKFIRPIAAVIITVAGPLLEDAHAIDALELIVGAAVLGVL